MNLKFDMPVPLAEVDDDVDVYDERVEEYDNLPCVAVLTALVEKGKRPRIKYGVKEVGEPTWMTDAVKAVTAPNREPTADDSPSRADAGVKFAGKSDIDDDDFLSLLGNCPGPRTKEGERLFEWLCAEDDVRQAALDRIRKNRRV